LGELLFVAEERGDIAPCGPFNVDDGLTVRVVGDGAGETRRDGYGHRVATWRRRGSGRAGLLMLRRHRRSHARLKPTFGSRGWAARATGVRRAGRAESQPRHWFRRGGGGADRGGS